jgi:hypothetical protein
LTNVGLVAILSWALFQGPPDYNKLALSLRQNLNETMWVEQKQMSLYVRCVIWVA